MSLVPSSKNRRRVELPAALYERIREIGEAEGRTVAGVAVDLIGIGLRRYTPPWHRGLAPAPTNLTARAERVLAWARTEAPTRFKHNYVGTEHLLLALVEESEGPAGRALARFGVTPEKVTHAIALMIGRGDQPFGGTPAETPRTKLVLSMANGEAQRLDHPFVGTGHLLLALVREGEGIAAGILESLEVDLLALRDAVVSFFERGEMPLTET